MMKATIWLLLLIIEVVNVLSTFEVKVQCPDPALRDVIGNYVCHRRKYLCLWDEVKLQFGEKCVESERLEQKGERTVLNNGYLNTKPCDNTTYQPFLFNASRNTGCVFQRSLCTEEGQRTVHFTSTVEDSRCRCDHEQGYAPVNPTKNPCFCVPSLEDCSCYKKPCGPGDELLPNYTCISKSKVSSQQLPCSDVLLVLETDPDSSLLEVYNILKKEESDKDHPAAIAVLVLTVLLIVIVVAYIRRKKIITAFLKITNGVKYLEEMGGSITCYEGEPVTMECIVNHPGLPNNWYKNQMQLTQSPKIICQDKGTKYSLDILEAELDDAGRYSFYKKKPVVKVLTVMKVEITIKLEKIYRCFVGDTIKMTCKVNTKKVRGCWSKNGSPITKNCFHQDILHDNEWHTLKLTGIVKEDEGKYMFTIRDLSCETNLQVLDINYFRLICLLEKVAQPVVQEIFDREFHPKHFEKMLNNNFSRIKELQMKGFLNNKEFKTLYPSKETGGAQGLEQERSKNFKIRIMIVLLKNIADCGIPPVDPEESDHSEGCDLYRISKIRNQLYNIREKEVPDEKFRELWKYLSEAIIRRDPEKKEWCTRLERVTPSPEECEVYLSGEFMVDDTLHGSASSKKNHQYFYIQGLTKEVEKAARFKFSELFKEPTLQTWVKEKNIECKLLKLKEDKKLTNTEWQQIFPSSGRPSKKMDLKLIIILLKIDFYYSPPTMNHLQKREDQAVLVLIEYLNDQLFHGNYDHVEEALDFLTNEKYKKADVHCASNKFELEISEHIKKEVKRRVNFQETRKEFETFLEKLQVPPEENGGQSVFSKWTQFIVPEIDVSPDLMYGFVEKLSNNLKDEKEQCRKFLDDMKINEVSSEQDKGS